jgi:hypothetical protein
VNIVFTSCLFVATASLAAWIIVRFPSLAPSFRWRTVGTVALAGVLQVVPVWTGSYATLYASIFFVLVPVLTLAWLYAAWLLQSLCDLGAMR